MATYEIGIIYDMTDPEKPVALRGWHVDSLQPLEGAESFLVSVNSPVHQFAGVDSDAVYRYKFGNKAQAAFFMPVQ